MKGKICIKIQQREFSLMIKRLMRIKISRLKSNTMIKKILINNKWLKFNKAISKLIINYHIKRREKTA